MALRVGIMMAAMHTLANFIDGRQVPPESGAYLDNIEPAVGTVCSHVPDSDAADVRRAVEAARRAFPQWSSMPAGDRSQVLLELAGLIEDNLEELARTESIDTGKPITLARTVDIPRAVANFRFFATAILHLESQAHFTDGRAINYTLRQPAGVAGCIAPWNLPLYLFTWKIAPALASGCTVVGKPSEVTPMTAFRLGELAGQAGLPGGVLNIVHGTGPKAGAALIAHPDVPVISFTGGTVTGKTIAQTAGPMLKKLALELGGKNPYIVFDDADFDDALDTAVRAAFANQGQICLCGSRMFVQRGMYDRFVKALVERAGALTIGDPLDEQTRQGALVSKAHHEKVLSYIQVARDEGGTIECGGEPPSPEDLPERVRNGYFLRPTVVTGLDAQCRTNQEEIFGPVTSVIPFDGEDEVIEAANSVPYGLAAMLWTNNIDRAHRVAARLDAGTIWVNCWLLRDLRVPFGGMKQSGLGREGGEEALHFFTEPKNVCIRVRGE